MAPLLRPDQGKEQTFSAWPALEYPCPWGICEGHSRWEAGAFPAELTDGAAGHGGEDPQGGRGPTFSYQGIRLSFILPPLDLPLQLPSLPRLTLVER